MVKGWRRGNQDRGLARSSRNLLCTVILGLLAMISSPVVLFSQQQTGYIQSNLVANSSGGQPHRLSTFKSLGNRFFTRRPLLGMVIATCRKKLTRGKYFMWISASALLSLYLLFNLGYGSGRQMNTTDVVTIAVTGTSGAISQSVQLTLTVVISPVGGPPPFSG
jgi:hypothetical protein